MIDHHNAPERNDRTTKCMLRVTIKRTKRRICREAKVAFVATSNEGVGPGVKILDQRSSRKDAMPDFERRTASVPECDYKPFRPLTNIIPPPSSLVKGQRVF